jgi:O-antigen ligase
MWYGALVGGVPLPLWITDANFAMWKDYMLLPIVMVAGGLVIEDRKSVRTLLIVALLTILVIDKGAIQNSIGSRTMTHFDESKRDGGPLGYAGSNGLAAFLAQFAMFSWGFGQYLKTRKYKILCYVLTGITIFATMYTFSRAAYISLVLITILLGVIKDRKLIPIVIVFLFTWQTLVPTAVTERVTMTTSSSGQLDGSSNERVLLWTAAEDSFLHSPIIGNGYATFAFGQHVDSLKDTHNWYVKVLVETGLIGFAIASIIVWKILALSWNIFRTSVDPLYKGLGLALFLTITSNLVLTFFGDRWTYLEINGLLWALLGAATRVYYLKDERETPEEVPQITPELAANPYLVMR